MTRLRAGPRHPSADGQQSGSAGPPGGKPPGDVARLSAVGWLRWAWRQLTSMRTALVLLFLLAVGSVPGSLLPQQGVDPAAVQQYFTAHPTLAPILAKLSLFNVFAAPWFAAIYLLLFTSLTGCVLPRAIRLAGAARQRPPRAPRNLARLPWAARQQTGMAPEQALDAAARTLSRKRFRIRRGDGWVSAEKGYLREAGNLLFHLSLLAILVAIGMGGVFGYKGNRLLVQGGTFANTVTSLDKFRPGRAVSPADLQPFTVTLRRFTASYVRSGPLRGQPSSFAAHISYTSQPGAPERSYDLRVNHPLNVDNVKVYLIGHGYAPVFKVTDGQGRMVFDRPVPFIAVNESGLTSEGVVKVPDARPQQLGFIGVFLPTAVDARGRLESVFPATLHPVVSLIPYAGNLGMNNGPPQSVYQLNTSKLHRLTTKAHPLAPGQSMKLPHGAGTVTFVGYRPWASLAITYDPGQLPALLGGVAALAGLLLSFFVRRRRVFVRAAPGPDGGAVVHVGGLTRSDASGGFEAEFPALADDIRSACDGRPAPQPPATHEPGPADSGPSAPETSAGTGDNAETGADLPSSLTDTTERE